MDKQAMAVWKSKLQTLIERKAKNISWKPPEEGWIKINSDSTYKLGVACAGVVVKYKNGSIIYASTAQHHCLDPLSAECLAILHACHIASKLKNVKTILESDCLEAITLISGGSANTFWTTGPVVDVIKKMWTAWPSWIFMFNPRSCNRSAHALAHWGANCNFYGVVALDSIPATVFCDKWYPLLNFSYY
ncbi:hypothetical protein CASFOL_031634 [Castilleja foliolosa]|uniref:RNase H type-1 domain-containing protein n=1 Tax=Castilleja foliolosa TaxID=1961234 RepID=A0ABD3C594_9LAMI